MIGATLGGEILIRAFIIDVREPFVAYMLVSNWLLVFLVGLAAGQREPSPLTAIPVSRVVLPALLLWIAWPVSMAVPSWRLTFPFMSLALDAPWPTALLLSGAVSFLYTGYALTGWAVATRLLPRHSQRFLPGTAPSFSLPTCLCITCSRMCGCP